MAFLSALAPGAFAPTLPFGTAFNPYLEANALARLSGYGIDPVTAALQAPQASWLQGATLGAMVQLLANLMQNQAAPNGASPNGSAPAGNTGNAASSGPMNSSSKVPSQNGFGEALLRRIGAPVTAENLRFLDAWQKAEGGSADNPFNTTQNAPGARRFNSVGVKRYSSMEEGLEATVKCLQNGRYNNIIAALRQGNSARNAAQALSHTPWGTGSLVLKILH